MTVAELAKTMDHSVLQPFLKDEDIIKGCEVALKWNTATVCARPGDMELVVKRLAGSTVKPCTVIGFPHGDSKPDVKLYECKRALDDGCLEIDMVQHVGKLLSGETGYVRDEIAAIAQACHERGAIVKVILENCYLTDEQKKLACQLCVDAKADFVKTSTGYGTSSATEADVRLMRACVPDWISVKAAGGIRTLEAVRAMLKAGANRIGVSATEKILEQAQQEG